MVFSSRNLPIRRDLSRSTATNFRHKILIIINRLRDDTVGVGRIKDIGSRVPPWGAAVSSFAADGMVLGVRCACIEIKLD